MKSIEVSEQEIRELIDFYEAKRDRLAKELQDVAHTLIKLTGTNGSTVKNVAIGSSIAWKYKIDEVLKQTSIPLPASKIVSQLLEMQPDLIDKAETVRKSVASALSQNSKDENSRYLKTIDKGLTYYELNPKFKE